MFRRFSLFLQVHIVAQISVLELSFPDRVLESIEQCVEKESPFWESTGEVVDVCSLHRQQRWSERTMMEVQHRRQLTAAGS